jgi:hypothetical protein
MEARRVISASALRRDCGYARILSKARQPTAAQQKAMGDGVIFHQAVETWARTRQLPIIADLQTQGWLDLLACEWEPPVDGEYEVAWGLRADDDGRPVYVEVTEPEPHVYVARDGGPLLTAGRADVGWWSVEGLCVADWKTGRWPAPPAEKNLQVNAAGIALALKRGAESYRPGIYYARDGFWDWGPRVVFGTPAADRILGEVRDAALLDETPRPGPQCGQCWERRACAHAAT